MSFSVDSGVAPAGICEGLAEPSGDVARPRILYAEDHEVVRETAAAFLRRTGYDVVTVGDGAQALKELYFGPFDLLITDNEMPFLSGLELIAKLRRQESALNIILASGAAGELRGPAMKQLRISGRLQKPFSSAELLDEVKAALDDCRDV